MDTLARMRAFVEIVEAGGFSAAARKIGRSKALLSKYVRELEDDLGTLLINRTTRQFSLTEAGLIYLNSAHEILEKISDMEDVVRESGSEPKGVLRISAPRSLSDIGLSEPLVQFAKENPQIALDINLDDRVVDLIEERFDLAFRIGRLEDSSLIAKRMAEFELVICATKEFLQLHPKINEPKDLAGVPAIVDTNYRGKRNWPFFDAKGNEFSQYVNAVLEVNDPDLCKQAALKNIGVTMVPDFAVKAELKSGDLVRLLEKHTPTGAGYFLVYADRRYVPAKIRRFVDFMTDWFKKR